MQSLIGTKSCFKYQRHSNNGVDSNIWVLEWNIQEKNLCMFVQFSLVAQSCPTLCDPMDCSTPSFPAYHQLPELAQTHVHQVYDAIQPCHPLPSSSPAFNLSQHQGLSQWVSSSHQVGGQSIGASASASASVLAMNIQDWFPWCVCLAVGLLGHKAVLVPVF